ncbi:hypothetical protein [Sphingomonas morindae]|uniref:Uncharacterized protein n=1 Tax=Sphingomonas morindae TaxID=1541170 RepID=A0ABY4X7C0_9SPHN|nr:hypothetical protein [Sphingomonas morindae]USI72823.1 hypothetical protein LHA26_16375 [Sphingomonas morindae]
MQPYQIITAITFCTIDIGRRIGESRRRIVGAATFTGHVDGDHVAFTLDASVLQASDPNDRLLRWLDDRFAGDRTTIAGYRLGDTCHLLETMEMAPWSAGVRALKGGDGRMRIDIAARKRGGGGLGFGAACAGAGMPVSQSGETEHFTAWCTGRPGAILQTLETDVISTWRLAMLGVACRSSLGGEVNTIIEGHLATWLRDARFPAARLHLASIEQSRA